MSRSKSTLHSLLRQRLLKNDVDFSLVMVFRLVTVTKRNPTSFFLMALGHVCKKALISMSNNQTLVTFGLHTTSKLLCSMNEVYTYMQ